MKFLQFSRYDGQRTASNVECLIVSIVFFTLPLVEAPKNVFSFFLVLVFLLNSIRLSSFGSSANFDGAVTILALVLWISPATSTLSELVSAVDSAPRWTLLAVFCLCLSRMRFSNQQTVVITLSFLFGGCVAVLEAFWIFQTNFREYPELRSVGHVNHSAMYITVVIAVGIGALFSCNKSLIAMGVISLLLSLWYLSVSLSIASALAAISIFIVAFLYSIYRLNYYILCGFLFFAAGFLVFLKLDGLEPFLSEIISRFSGSEVFSGRDKILNSALSVWYQNPIFGSGWKSFGIATSEREVVLALSERRAVYDPSLYWHEQHGHNLWTTLLIERGLVGVLSTVVLLWLYLFNIIASLRDGKKLKDFDFFTVVSLSGILVGFVIGGLGNTTMINEHGQAGMGLFAIYWSYLRFRKENALR